MCILLFILIKQHDNGAHEMNTYSKTKQKVIEIKINRKRETYPKQIQFKDRPNFLNGFFICILMRKEY